LGSQDEGASIWQGTFLLCHPIEKGEEAGGVDQAFFYLPIMFKAPIPQKKKKKKKKKSNRRQKEREKKEKKGQK
jgi:hypothetical protein